MATRAIAVPRLHEPRKTSSIARGFVLVAIAGLCVWGIESLTAKAGVVAEIERNADKPVGIIVPLSERSPAEQGRIREKADKLLAKEKAKYDWLVGSFEGIEMMSEPLSRTEPGLASLVLKLGGRRCVHGVRVSADGPRSGEIIVGDLKVAVGGNPSGADYKTVILDKPQIVESITLCANSTQMDRLTVYSLVLYCQK